MSTRKGPKPTGALIAHGEGYSARLRFQGERLTLRMEVANEAEAIERKAALASMGARLARSGWVGDGKDLLERAARAKGAEAWQTFVQAIDTICSGDVEEVNARTVPTFATFALAWTSGDLHLAHPDHVAAKDATRDEEHLRNYIGPVLDKLRLNEITLAHAEAVMAKIPADRAAGTRKAVAQCMRKVLSYAVYPGKHIATNPIPREWMPKTRATAKRAKALLWPAEDAKLMACTEVPLLRRLAYGLLAREGLRASELANLRFGDLDLDRGLLRLDENKTDDPRAWKLGDDVRAALVTWHAMVKVKLGDVDPSPDARVLEADGVPLDVTRLAESLREDLDTAKVKRPELFEQSSSRMRLRAHDLRALFVTANLANGKTETWVRDRTGHRSSQMVATYTRQARTWGELGLGTLAPLDAVLPELAAYWPSIGLSKAPPARVELAANALGKRCSIH